MFRTMLIALPAILLFAAAAPAQDALKKAGEKELAPQTPKTSPKTGPAIKSAAHAGIPGEVEINFLNGSTVRMLLQSDKVEIATPYGNLAVPVKDIRAIDFGVHFPDGIDTRIQLAIKNLGGENYNDRDQASKSLIELGPYSFPAVVAATRVEDLEISRRAKEVVKQLQAKHPKKDLKTETEDRLVTPSFTIVGRIQTTSLKAKAELFGDVSLPVARMRGLRSLYGSTPDIELVIEAEKYAAQGQWMETEFQVDGRSTISITAKGTVDTWPQQNGQFMVGPNGLQGRNQGLQIVVPAGRKIRGQLNGNTYGGMLLGKIGEDGETFTIGERYEFTPETQGKLYLHIGPSPWNVQCNGSYEVKIGRKN
ncbi:MAG: hypothetical protein HY040_06520 [Planctomycetes bacterium]|nr:hypothetical protein [Planctomycetota bacterium]